MGAELKYRGHQRVGSSSRILYRHCPLLNHPLVKVQRATGHSRTAGTEEGDSDSAANDYRSSYGKGTAMRTRGSLAEEKLVAEAVSVAEAAL